MKLKLKHCLNKNNLNITVGILIANALLFALSFFLMGGGHGAYIHLPILYSWIFFLTLVIDFSLEGLIIIALLFYLTSIFVVKTKLLVDNSKIVFLTYIAGSIVSVITFTNISTDYSSHLVIGIFFGSLFVACYSLFLRKLIKDTL